MVTKGRRVAYAMTPGVQAPPSFEQPEHEEAPLPPISTNPLDPDADPDDPDNPNAMPSDEFMEEEEEEELPPLTADDIDLTFLWIWLGIIGGLTVVEGALTFLVIRCRRWWPIELNCPACDVRLDELGGAHERCPSCTARLA